jgi:glycosyltransferase involved in cell wall biosynthesis
MATQNPRVSIGLPVYNGQKYLEEALDSILSQTFGDFELIISDNASDDRTEEIGRRYAARDARVRYYRNERNLGGAENFNRAFRLSSGEYFQWVAHDDILAAEFLQKCVDVLDRDPSVVLCYSRQVDIGDSGEVLRRDGYGLDTSLREPEARFREVLQLYRGAPAIFGVARSAVMAKTGLFGRHSIADLIFLAELALHGRFEEVPEDLFYMRQHELRSVYTHPTRHSSAVWFDPTKADRIVFPAWRTLAEHLRSLWRAPLNLRQRSRCHLHLLEWMRRNRRMLKSDLVIATRQMLQRYWGIGRPGPRISETQPRHRQRTRDLTAR